MDIYVLNEQFEPIALIDAYTSCIWTSRCYQVGDFELLLPATDTALSLLQENRMLIRDIDYKEPKLQHIMIIKNIKITTDADTGDSLLITGYCLKWILNRRVITDQTIIMGRLTNIIIQLLRNNITEPLDVNRRISNFDIWRVPTLDTRVTLQLLGDNLLEVFESLCTTYNLTWDIFYNTETRKLCFEILDTCDRSSTVIFSNEFDNLINSEYTRNAENYRNVAIVGGEGEGNNRRNHVVGTSTGINRYEVFVDAKDVSSNNGEVASDNYVNLLTEVGTEALTEYQYVEAFDGEADTTRNFVLNQDFFLGDIVTVVNDYGVSARTRVTQIIECNDDTGISVVPTFTKLEG